MLEMDESFAHQPFPINVIEGERVLRTTIFTAMGQHISSGQI